MMNVNQWWTLRDKFKNSLPRSGVTPSYLATVFSVAGQPAMTEKSAKDNILSPLKIMGLVDKDGMPTELAEEWRADSDYQSVCEKIRDNVYPQELLDVLPPPEPDYEAAKHWFMRNARVGEVAGERMATTYQLLCQADLSKREIKAPRTKSTGRKTTPSIAAPRSKEPAQDSMAAQVPQVIAATADAPRVTHGGAKVVKVDPSVHIDIQIHISPESSDKQIETIFANMAKHLYGARSSDAE
jgi:hypothetical protein